VKKGDSNKIRREHDFPIAVMVKVAFPGKKLVEQEPFLTCPEMDIASRAHETKETVNQNV
jgi:hypothetical protein